MTNYSKEYIKKTVTEGILKAYENQPDIDLCDTCAHASYLVRDLLGDIYGIESSLKAGTLFLITLDNTKIGYNWNPPYEFHMWVEIGNEIIDIAIGSFTDRIEFKAGGAFAGRKNRFKTQIVWGDPPKNMRYEEMIGGVDRIDPPYEPVFESLYDSAFNYINKKNELYKNKEC